MRGYEEANSGVQLARVLSRTISASKRPLGRAAAVIRSTIMQMR